MKRCVRDGVIWKCFYIDLTSIVLAPLTSRGWNWNSRIADDVYYLLKGFVDLNASGSLTRRLQSPGISNAIGLSSWGVGSKNSANYISIGAHCSVAHALPLYLTALAVFAPSNVHGNVSQHRFDHLILNLRRD